MDNILMMRLTERYFKLCMDCIKYGQIFTGLKWAKIEESQTEVGLRQQYL